MAKIKPNKKSDNQALELQLKRALADYANLERRFTSESSQVIRFANSSLIQKLLDFQDNLDLAIANTKDQGIQMVAAQFTKILEDEDVKEIDTKGEFDPTTMESSEVLPGKKNQIIQVIRKGYTLHDRVLRPASVTVGNGQNK